MNGASRQSLLNSSASSSFDGEATHSSSWTSRQSNSRDAHSILSPHSVPQPSPQHLRTKGPPPRNVNHSSSSMSIQSTPVISSAKAGPECDLLNSTISSTSSLSHGAEQSSSDGASRDLPQQPTRVWDESSASDTSQVFLSLFWGGGKLGAAAYDCKTTEITVLPDAEEKPDFTLVSTLMAQLDPQKVIVSSKQDERLLNYFKFIDDPEFLQLMPSIDFSVALSQRRILNMDLPAIPEDSSLTERHMYITSLVPINTLNVTTRALGGLLKWLEKYRIGIQLEDAGAKVPVLTIKLLHISELMILCDNSYSALQIFQRENHPSVYKSAAKGAGKEGLSLFGIMNKCRSHIGSELLRLWFLRPTRNLTVLKSRLAAVSFMVNPRNSEVVSTLQSCLKNVKNLSTILVRMREAQATPNDWQSVYRTLYNAAHIAETIRCQSANVELFEKISSLFTEDLNQLANLVTKIVDFEESIACGRFVVKSNVDEDLDKKKRTFNGLPDFMTDVARQEMENLETAIETCSVLYMPQLGYLLKIAVNAYLEEHGCEIPGMTLVFMADSSAHYKTERTKEMDTMFGDTQLEIQDMETALMFKLQNTILQHTDLLLKVTDYTAQLDCLLSLATSAQELNLVMPVLTEECILEVRGGRHILQELCCNPFVPNDAYSGNNHGKMKVLTGPNASGKSIYLKQVALIVFLAHIGSFVPAEAAVIGLTDRIFTRIRSLESISTGLSTFMLDLSQVSNALNSATERSLVILDEFGKGTDSVDGTALLVACLRYWLLGVCPHVFVSTHFLSIIRHHLLPPSPLLKLQTMEVLENGDDLVFLYQLKEGVAKCSKASHVAAVAGIPQHIITRAAEIIELKLHGRPVNKQLFPNVVEKQKRFEDIAHKLLKANLDKESDLKELVALCTSGPK